MSLFNVKDFGAIGDGLQDDFPAFRSTEAIDAASQNDLHQGGILFIPAGKYRLSQTLKITRNLVVQGTGSRSSILQFVRKPDLPQTTPFPGILVEQEQRPNGITTYPHWTVIRELGIYTNQAFSPPAHLPSTVIDDNDHLPDGTSSGIVLYARASIENCLVVGFEHDGIHINTSAGKGRNANIWQIRNCFVQSNGRHGLFVSGGDANAGCAIGLFALGNCKWGIYDRSFLGNTYVGCGTESNGHVSTGTDDPYGDFGGSYRTNNPNARHCFLGCYSEGNQVSLLRYPSMLIGGMQAAPIRKDPESNRNLVLVRNEGEATVNRLKVNGSSATTVRTVTPIAAQRPQPINLEDSVILANATIGAIPLTLPPLSSADMMGRQYTIKKVDRSTHPVAISIAPERSEQIDGGKSIELTQPFSWVILIAGAKLSASGSELDWYVIGRG